MATDLHKRLVAQILSRHPDASTAKGFVKRMLELYRIHFPRPTEDAGHDCGIESGPCPCYSAWDETFKEHADCFRFQPDAWAERTAEHGIEIVCWEVHVTTTPRSKIRRYLEAYWALDDLGAYRVRLLNVDMQGEESEIDLFLHGLDSGAE